ncbi:mannose-6-phosphate isomerase, class I [Leucobacter ruminantium]|uniref:mannose-6-phosphate isomerase n=1 Tax=Leucobacter ruminantium TaxID=1289170 RepID=A0A939M1J2_9MICO|nr:mannose-6-phosphate isomerase, class I [Leucobacter ruminantium]MBO1805350.1 mannose-6-phosphate isomerase, class I [Leucobacter ruminantium]
MLIFIENTPRAYAWGSRRALPEMLGTQPTGEPQAELWLGAHPGSPASVAKATPQKHTLIDLIESDPELYGVNGGQLPFLLKVLAIGAPLSLQVHPDLEQARAGFEREEVAGVPRDARDRNYGDPNHKPELLVALSEVTALSGFRPLAEARADLAGLARLARMAGLADGAGALERVAERLQGRDPSSLRPDFLVWAFSADPVVEAAVAAIAGIPDELVDEGTEPGPHRRAALRELVSTHPGDPGVLVSLLLHLVRLDPGEAIYLEARHLHAYLGGIGVEVMAASDNVLRAGLTEKHVDIGELCRILEPDELAEPRFPCAELAPGLVAWRPDVPDFQLLRARLRDPEATRPARALPGSAEAVSVRAEHPLVLIVTAGRVRVERPDAEFDEVATPRRGQSLYVSAGSPIRITGEGEAFIATVGAGA